MDIMPEFFRKYYFAVVITLCLIIVPQIATADYDGLTGDWGGSRSRLSDAGIDFEIIYTVDVMSNVAGGLRRRTAVLDNLDLTATFDGEKLYNIKGSTIFLYVLNNNGGKPNEHDVGSLQGVDNIEVETMTAKLYEAWIEQTFFDDSLSIRAGLYDLNSEFYVTDTSGLFLNATFGIGTDFSQSGQAGPSIFPTTSPGVRVKWEPTSKSYLQAVILGGVPGDPNDGEGTQIQFDDGDGVLQTVEGGYSFDFARIALGGWRYTARFDDLTEVDGLGAPVQEHNHGLYLMAEKDIFENIAWFGRYGIANKDVNQSDYAWSTGLLINNIIRDREDSQLGIAVSRAHNSRKFKNAQAALGAPVDTAEMGFEITFSDQITPWLRIQPDVQYTINPGTDPALKNSWLVGARFEIAF